MADAPLPTGTSFEQCRALAHGLAPSACAAREALGSIRLSDVSILTSSGATPAEPFNCGEPGTEAAHRAAAALETELELNLADGDECLLYDPRQVIHFLRRSAEKLDSRPAKYSLVDTVEALNAGPMRPTSVRSRLREPFGAFSARRTLPKLHHIGFVVDSI